MWAGWLLLEAPGEGVCSRPLRLWGLRSPGWWTHLWGLCSASLWPPPCVFFAVPEDTGHWISGPPRTVSSPDPSALNDTCRAPSPKQGHFPVPELGLGHTVLGATAGPCLQAAWQVPEGPDRVAGPGGLWGAGTGSACVHCQPAGELFQGERNVMSLGKKARSGVPRPWGSPPSAEALSEWGAHGSPAPTPGLCSWMTAQVAVPAGCVGSGPAPPAAGPGAGGRCVFGGPAGLSDLLFSRAWRPGPPPGGSVGSRTAPRSTLSSGQDTRDERKPLLLTPKAKGRH